jgi:hypothetical protein
MKTEDVIRMAREAGAKPSNNPDKWDILEISDESLKRFAAFVAAYEREECAKLADKYMERWTYDAIRARK